MVKRMVMALAVGALTTACATTVEYRLLGTEPLKDSRGHVTGHKDLLKDPRSGDEFERVTMYEPLFDESGEVHAYQEPTRGGMLIRSLDGRPIGARYTDLRSRGSNPGAGGVQIIIRGEQR